MVGAIIGGNTQGAAIGAGLGALGGYVWSKLNIPSDISFDTGRADIKPNLRPILDQLICTAICRIV